MACTGVPHIVLHVLCSTRTSGGYYEPSEIRFEGILAPYLYKRNRPKGPKIPLNLTSEGLKYPQEVRVQHETFFHFFMYLSPSLCISLSFYVFVPICQRSPHCVVPCDNIIPRTSAWISRQHPIV